MKEWIPPRAQRLVKLLALLTAAVAAAVFIFYDTLALRLALIWNIFLAGLPLAFALLALRAERKNAALPVRAALWILWLVFFPNAPYMVTDFVHITRYGYYQRGVGFLPLTQSWFGLLHLGLGIALGVLYGMLSLYFLHGAVAGRHGRRAGWLFCGAVSALSGFAIYLGRFMRFNTWDLVVRPHHIALRVWESLSPETFALYAVFAAMTLLPYLLFHACFHTE